MPSLPIPGASKNAWGNQINEFLRVAHNEDGSFKLDGISINASKPTQVEFGADGSIIETSEDLPDSLTVFNPDGSITTTYGAPINKTITTTFNADGSITEVEV